MNENPLLEEKRKDMKAAGVAADLAAGDPTQLRHWRRLGYSDCSSRTLT